MMDIKGGNRKRCKILQIYRKKLLQLKNVVADNYIYMTEMCTATLHQIIRQDPVLNTLSVEIAEGGSSVGIN